MKNRNPKKKRIFSFSRGAENRDRERHRTAASERKIIYTYISRGNIYETHRRNILVKKKKKNKKKKFYVQREYIECEVYVCTCIHMCMCVEEVCVVSLHK